MNWKILQRHPLNVVPNSDEQELDELRTSILEYGFDARYPIWAFQGPDDAEPMVIDGMQRLGICIELDIQPLVREYVGTELDAIGFIEKSIKRRNLDSGQRIIVFKELNKLKIIAMEKEALNNKESSQFGGEGSTTPNQVNVADWIAKETGTSPKTVKQINKIEKYSPELYEAVKTGKINTASAYRQVQEKEASSDQRIKMNAKKIIMKKLNEAVKEYGPGFMSQVIRDLKEDGHTNIKFKIVIDD